MDGKQVREEHCGWGTSKRKNNVDEEQVRKEQCGLGTSTRRTL